jgi:hypothetical protein
VSRNCDCQQQGGREPGSSGTFNPGEVPQASSHKNKRKLLLRLDQNGTWPGPQAPNSCGAAVEPPASRHDLTHSATSAERGNPVILPTSGAKEEGPLLARAATG